MGGRKKYRKGDRGRVWDMTGGHCYYCGRELTEQFPIDHFIPLSEGGADDISNFVPSCPECNALKSNHTIDEFRVRLHFYRRNVKTPSRGQARLIHGIAGNAMDPLFFEFISSSDQEVM